MRNPRKNRALARLFRITVVIFIFIIPIGVVGAQSPVEVSIHFAQGAPADDGISHDVSVFFSLLDSSGNPIRNIDTNSINVTENGQIVDIDNVQEAQDEPINVYILLDTSTSMRGEGIQSAKKAAANFIDSLKPTDGVAITHFNQQVTSVIALTNDHKAVKDEIALIDAAPNAGTCMYDAVYNAIETASQFPPGQRAILLLTDGVDEVNPGQPCSQYTIEDVISIASEGSTRIPIFTLGMTNGIDQGALKRIAARTGGRFLFSRNARELDALFERLTDQLKSQYVLTYNSQAGPGPHTLVLQLEHLGAADQDSRNFVLPELAPTVSILSPKEGDHVTGETSVIVSIKGDELQVEKIDILMEGDKVATIPKGEVETKVDFSDLPPGSVALSAVVIGAEGQPINEADITLVIPDPSAGNGTDNGGDDPTPAINDPVDEGFNLTNTILIVIAGLLAVGIIVFAVIWSRRGKSTPSETPDLTGEENVFASLTIQESDDPDMVSTVIALTKTLIKIGRLATNDVIFSQDSPVSREHAVIEKRSDAVYISEVSTLNPSDGSIKWPTYGTFVNDSKLSEGESRPLAGGDIIRVGNRVEMKFDIIGAIAQDDASMATLDNLIVEIPEELLEVSEDEGKEEEAPDDGYEATLEMDPEEEVKSLSSGEDEYEATIEMDAEVDSGGDEPPVYEATIEMDSGEDSSDPPSYDATVEMDSDSEVEDQSDGYEATIEMDADSQAPTVESSGYDATVEMDAEDPTDQLPPTVESDSIDEDDQDDNDPDSTREML